jgi:hypothetical protein
MATRARKQQGTGNQKMLTPGPAFTTDELRNVLKETKRKEWVLPENAQIERLASILNIWKAQFYAAQQSRLFNEKLAEAEAAIISLRRLMPEIYQHRKTAADAGDWFSVPMAESAKRLLEALDFPDSYPGTLPPVLACVHRDTHKNSFPNALKDWRWLIKVMPVDFEAAMRPANPSIIFGKSKGGPLTRFLEAIIPRVTGENPPASAIGAQLILANGADEDPSGNFEGSNLS